MNKPLGKDTSSRLLGESDEKYRVLYENSHDAILISNGKVFIECNDKTLVMFGCNREHILKRSLTDFAPKYQNDGELSELKAKVIIDSAYLGNNKIVQWQCIKYDGTIFSTEISICRLVVKENDYLQIVIRDISHHKQLEEKLYLQKEILFKINKFSSDIINLPSKDTHQFIVDKAKEIFNVKIAILNKFDAKNSQIIVQSTTLENDEISFIVKKIGKTIIGFKTPVNSTQISLIKSNEGGRLSSLSDLTFGAIPETIGNLIQKVLGIGWFIGLGLVWQDQLLGTLILTGDSKQHFIYNDELMAFTSIVANSMQRLKTLQLLEQKDFLIKDIFDGLPHPAFILTKEAKIIYVNDFLASFFRFPKDFLFGKDIFDYIPEGTKELRQSKFNEVLVSGNNINFEDSRNDKHFNNFLFPIKNTNDEIESIVGFAVDISEKKKIEQQIFDNQKRLLFVFEHLETVAIQSYNEEGIITFWNKACDNLYGFTKEEAIGKNILELLFNGNEEERDAEKALMEKALATGYLPGSQEIEILNSNGESTIIIASRVLYEHPNGDKEFFCFDVDITPIKKTQQELKESEAKYRFIIENTADTIYMLDLDLNFTFISPQVLKMRGYTSQEALNQSIWEILTPNSYQFVMAEFQKLMQNEANGLHEANQSFIFEFEQINKDKTLFWTEDTISLFRDKNGKAIGILGISRDISEKKKSEENIMRLNAELEEKVIKRTSELQLALDTVQDANYELNVLNEQVLTDSHKILQLNSELIDSQDKLTNALEIKDKIFQIIGHDLKNPFVTLINNSALLEQRFTEMRDDVKLKLINGIKQTSESSYQLLENLLLWAKAQRQDVEFESRTYLISELFDKSLKVIQAQADTKGIIIDKDLEYDYYVKCDSNMICTVIRNLLSNAIKFSYPNSKIILSSKADSKNKEKVIIAVQDFGTGMDEFLLNRILHKDGIISKNGTINENGSGLGLFLCSEFIDIHNEKFMIESKSQEGSTFSFTLSMG